MTLKGGGVNNQGSRGSTVITCEMTFLVEISFSWDEYARWGFSMVVNTSYHQ